MFTYHRSKASMIRRPFGLSDVQGRCCATASAGMTSSTLRFLPRISVEQRFIRSALRFARNRWMGIILIFNVVDPFQCNLSITYHFGALPFHMSHAKSAILKTYISTPRLANQTSEILGSHAEIILHFQASTQWHVKARGGEIECCPGDCQTSVWLKSAVVPRKALRAGWIDSLICEVIWIEGLDVKKVFYRWESSGSIQAGSLFLTALTLLATG